MCTQQKWKLWKVKSNSKIRTALRCTRRCHSDFKALRTTEALLRYIHAKCKLQGLIDRQTAEFEVYVSYVNSKLKSNLNFINSVKVGNRVVENPDEAADETLECKSGLNQHRECI